MGDCSEHVIKRLRIVESSQVRPVDNGQLSDTKQESEMFEHIKQGETAYDAQTYGR